MSLSVIFDESHGEQISVFNCRGLSYVIQKLKIVSYRLISGPITIDKISSEDVLFLGAPTRKFLEFEIKSMEYFVSKGKCLIIVCPMPMPFNFTLNELAAKFGLQFQQIIVQDKKHNLSGAMYYPVIKQFQKDAITRDLKEIIYSGCSIRNLSPDVKVLALSDDHAEPPSAPILVSAKEGRVVCLGGHTLFQDDNRYGIKAKSNIRLVANIFRSMQSSHPHLVKEEIPSKPPEKKKLKPVDPKKAKKHFEQLTQKARSELNRIMDDIDKLFDEILKLTTTQKFILAENTLKTRYSKHKDEIQIIYQDLMEKLDEISARIRGTIDFPAVVKDYTDQILVLESEALSKLDMIRFNLLNRLKTEKLRSEPR